MDQRQRAELTMLAEKLPLVPAEKFDMSFWGDGRLDLDTPEFTCGFAGCAIGWAPKLIPNCGIERWDHGVRFGGESGFRAVALYFGIDEDQADYLFARYSYSEETVDLTPLVVANRIMRFLNEA
jgi:hypothetical protein